MEKQTERREWVWPQSTAEGSRDPNPSRGCRPSLQRTHHPGEGTRGSIWEEQAGRDPRHPSASAPRSSEQRHVRAIQQQESLADHRQPHSVLPTAQGECCGHMPQGGTQGVPEQGWGRKRPSDHWALWPSHCHNGISTHPEHLSCSFFTFSHIQATSQLLLALLHADLGAHWLRGGLLQAWNDRRAVSQGPPPT